MYFIKKEKFYRIRRRSDGKYSQAAHGWGSTGKVWNAANFKRHLALHPNKYDTDSYEIITLQPVSSQPYDPEVFNG